MIVTKQYNNVSSSMIPKLEKDQVAIYVSAKEVVKNGVARHPTNILYAVTDTIRDTKTGEVVEIAYVTKDAPEGKQPTIGNVEFNTEDNGVITIMGSIPSQKHLFDFLELSNFNGSNPNRDITKPIWYYRRDAGFDTIQKLEKAGAEAQATNYALTAPIEDIKKALTDRKVNVKNLTEDAIRVKAIEEGKKKPLALSTNVAVDSFAKLVSECFELGVIKYSPVEKSLVNTQTGNSYPVEGLTQTMTADKKKSMLVAACKANPDLHDFVYSEIQKHEV